VSDDADLGNGWQCCSFRKRVGCDKGFCHSPLIKGTLSVRHQAAQSLNRAGAMMMPLILIPILMIMFMIEPGTSSFDCGPCLRQATWARWTRC
jgi:hypothetical protein